MKNKGRGVSEEEIQEAATETPTFLGCPQHMPTHLPGGFDGVEPASKKRSDLEKLNDLLLERLMRIRRISDDAIMDVRTDKEHNKAFLAACTEIRKLVDFYKPDEGKGRIVIEHDGKKYGVDDFEVVEGFFNDHIQVAFGMCICPKCGCDRSWIMAKELK